MKLQYITDSKGKNMGVFIPIKDWEIIKSKLKELGVEEPQPTKEEILYGLEEALKEVKLHTQGKIELQTAEDFLDEL